MLRGLSLSIYFPTVIELACGEYGEDKVSLLIAGSENGRSLQWFEDLDTLMDAKGLRGMSLVILTMSFSYILKTRPTGGYSSRQNKV